MIIFRECLIGFVYAKAGTDSTDKFKYLVTNSCL